MSAGRSTEKREKASTFANESVSFPRAGRVSQRKSRSTAYAPHTSLPCVSALIITCGPGRPESKVWT